MQRTIAYSRPARVAASLPAPYWNDFSHVHYTLAGHAPEWRQVTERRQECLDEWGNTWSRLDTTSKGEVVRGALEDWADLATWRVPDLANPANFQRVRAVCADPDNGSFRVGGLPGFPFNIVRYIRRLERFLMDVLLSSDAVLALLLRIEFLLADVIAQYAQAGVDAIMFPEDWGTQTSLMIRPQTWRGMFKPGYVRLCRVAHELGLRVFMHSCGKITDIIPDLIEAGVDVLQFDQPRLHGIDTLARFRGRVTFWCPVDIQTTLQSLDQGAIEGEARELLVKLGGPDGGFIAGYYGDNVSIGLDPHWQDVACRTFVQYGRYQSGARACKQ